MAGNFTIGLDLGKERDYSALVVVERLVAWTGRIMDSPWGQQHDTDDHFHVRHIERFQLGTPYTAVVDRTGDLLQTDELLGAELIVDATGVGRGIVDMFNVAYSRGLLGHTWPIPMTITGGERPHRFTVPKRDLVSKVQALLETGRLKMPAELPLADALKKELLAFRVKISKSGHDSYEAWRESDHDDLVLALALACWRQHHYTTPRAISRAGEVLDPDQVAGGARSRTLTERLQ